MRKPVKFQNKTIGFIEDEYNSFKFVAFRDPIKHVMKKWNALGLSIKVMDGLKAQGIENIEYTLGTTKYEVPLSKYYQSNLEHNNDGDIQRFVRIEHMELIGDTHRKDHDLNTYFQG